MNDTKQPVSEKSPEYLAATLREVAETLTDVGKTIDARLGAWEETAEPEPEPPSVEVMSAATGALRRYKSIASFDRMGTMWEVCGETVGGGNVHTMTSPFSIWQSALAAGVPCCDPPYADLTLNIGDRWRVFSIMELRVSPHTGNSFIRCIGNRPDYGARYAVENTYYVTESPSAIRALCAEAGVPCPPASVILSSGNGSQWEFRTVTAIDDDAAWSRVVGEWLEWHKHNVGCLANPDEVRALCDAAGVPRPEEEKPKTIAVEDRVGDVWRFRTIESLSARMVNGTPMLCIRHDSQPPNEWCETAASLADIQRQATEAGIDLPKVTVSAGYEWSHIAEVQHRADGTTIFGQVAGEGIHNETSYTPAQVVALCKLAGWPKPEVHMVCTFCDGTPCEIDPASVCSVDTIRLPGERSTLVTCEDGSTSCFVREPVAVVEAMRDACKEGE